MQNVKILEAGSRTGGAWLQNRYPGCRVDIPSPYYAFGFEEVSKTWNWTERFASREEMLAYFEHVDRVMSISKDCIFNTRVKEAEFDREKARWTLHTESRLTTIVVAKYFIPTVGGHATKEYVPPWRGIESFQGPIHHSSSWPTKGVYVRGKRVAVIGTGESGVQIIQEWAKEAAELFVFQRTPNLALPMPPQIGKEQEDLKKDDVSGRAWSALRNSFDMGPWDVPVKKMFAEMTLEEWEEAMNDNILTKGGFRMGMTDMIVNPKRIGSCTTSGQRRPGHASTTQ